MLNEEALRVLESLDGWVEFSTVHNKFAFFCQIINLIWNIDFNWGFSKIFFLFFRQHFFFFIFVDVFFVWLSTMLWDSSLYIWHISGSHWARSSLKQRSKEKAWQARWTDLVMKSCWRLMIGNLINY